MKEERSMVVYLDWNIIDGISKGRFPELKNLLHSTKRDSLIRIPYTEMHVYEACNIPLQTANRLDLKQRNLEAIFSVSGTDYFELSEDEQNIICRQRDPRIDFKEVDNLHLFNPIASGILMAMEPIRESALQYGLSSIELNNIEDPEELIQRFDQAFASAYKDYAHLWPMPITFREIMQLSFVIIDRVSDKNRELNYISHLFTTLDLLGFHSDRLIDPETKRISLWLDSYHAFWGNSSTVFISGDRRMRQKAKIAYYIMGCDTPVFSSDEGVLFLTNLNS